jgi:hypothetical protein
MIWLADTAREVKPFSHTSTRPAIAAMMRKFRMATHFTGGRIAYGGGADG